MNKSTKTVLILCALIAFLAVSIPATARKAIKRRGSTYTTDNIVVSNIESMTTEIKKSGLIHYSVKAKARNRTSDDLTVTLQLQAVDRDGYEVEDVIFYKKKLRLRDTAIWTDKLVVDAADYNRIWEWKIEKLRVE